MTNIKMQFDIKATKDVITTLDYYDLLKAWKKKFRWVEQLHRKNKLARKRLGNPQTQREYLMTRSVIRQFYEFRAAMRKSYPELVNLKHNESSSS